MKPWVECWGYINYESNTLQHPGRLILDKVAQFNRNSNHPNLTDAATTGTGHEVESYIVKMELDQFTKLMEQWYAYKYRQ